MRPNAEKHQPNPYYLRSLFRDFKKLGTTRAEVCQRIGVPYRTMSDYLNNTCPTQAPYTVQYALEQELAYIHDFRSSKENVDTSENRL